MSASNAAFVLNAVSVEYPNAPALEDASVPIDRGETTLAARYGCALTRIQTTLQMPGPLS